MGALGLLLVLHTHDVTGSYGRGGLATGVYLIALGVSRPVLARLVDRGGQTAVLRVGALVESGAILALALLPADVPFGAIVAAAALAGLGPPPVAGGGWGPRRWPRRCERSGPRSSMPRRVATPPTRSRGS